MADPVFEKTPEFSTGFLLVQGPRVAAGEELPGHHPVGTGERDSDRRRTGETVNRGTGEDLISLTHDLLILRVELVGDITSQIAASSGKIDTG